MVLETKKNGQTYLGMSTVEEYDVKVSWGRTVVLP